MEDNAKRRDWHNSVVERFSCRRPIGVARTGGLRVRLLNPGVGPYSFARFVQWLGVSLVGGVWEPPEVKAFERVLFGPGRGLPAL